MEVFLIGFIIRPEEILYDVLLHIPIATKHRLGQILSNLRAD